MKKHILLLSVLLLFTLWTLGCETGPNGCDGFADGGGTDGSAPAPETDAPDAVSNCEVTTVPAAVRQRLNLSNFYQKYADADGLPIVTSNNPPDEALIRACELVKEMTMERDDVRQALIRNKVHFTIIGINEKTTDIPEYSMFPDYYNVRARGLGGQVASCAEENILCQPGDRWRGESICVHEFSHTISTYGLYSADPTFERRLTQLYQNARSAGTYRNTYAMDMPQEYWAEGVQDWYDTNLESIPANGVHNHINTQAELLQYDPDLYDLINELLPEDTKWFNCYNQ